MRGLAIGLTAAALAGASPLLPTGYALNGVAFFSDVIAQSKIDLDVRFFALALKNPYWESSVVPPGAIDFGEAVRVYTQNTSSSRTMQSLSTQAPTPMQQESLMQQYIKYFTPLTGTTAYADYYIMQALNGSHSTPEARAQFAQIGFVALSLWMQVFHEISEGLANCVHNVPFEQGDHGSAPIEESWAYYTGSLEGPYRDHTHNGYLLWALADSLCPYFNTCINGGKMSIINSRTLALYLDTQSTALDGLCSQMTYTSYGIQRLLRTVLVQGLVMHIWEADVNSSYEGSSTSTREVEKAEAWAYTLSLLPVIQGCDAALASQLSTWMDYTAPNRPSSWNSLDVIARLQSIYRCMNVRCADVGSLAGLEGAVPLCTDPSQFNTQSPVTASSAAPTTTAAPTSTEASISPPTSGAPTPAALVCDNTDNGPLVFLVILLIGAGAYAFHRFVYKRFCAQTRVLRGDDMGGFHAV